MSKQTKDSAEPEEEHPYGPVYIQSSNPDQSIFNFVRNLSEAGHIVYFQSGKPQSPPACPPGGCQ